MGRCVLEAPAEPWPQPWSSPPLGTVKSLFCFNYFELDFCHLREGGGMSFKAQVTHQLRSPSAQVITCLLPPWLSVCSGTALGCAVRVRASSCKSQGPCRPDPGGSRPGCMGGEALSTARSLVTLGRGSGAGWWARGRVLGSGGSRGLQKAPEEKKLSPGWLRAFAFTDKGEPGEREGPARGLG